LGGRWDEKQCLEKRWKRIRWEVKWRRKREVGGEKKDDYRRKAERWRTW
jgi:hypothetical protein